MLSNDQTVDYTSVSKNEKFKITKNKSNFFCNKFRFFILFLGLLCLSAVFSNMITLNFTIICMNHKPNNSDTVYKNNLSSFKSFTNFSEVDLDIPLENDEDYTQYEKTVLQWTVSIASLITTFPFSWLCTKYGARYVFFVSGIFSIISTGLIPIASSYGFTAFVIVRIFQGFAYACDFAVIGVLCTRWASLKENAKFLGILTCFTPLSSFATYIFSGMICESSLGWPWVHYFHSIFSGTVFLLWILFYTDNPKTNYFVTKKELKIIHQNKTEAHITHKPFVPYMEILKDKVVWAVWVNAFADLFSGTFLLIYAPTYIKNVLGYSATETGILGALTALAHIPVKILCGYVSDTFKCLPERQKMQIFNTVALFSPAAVYIYLCYAPSNLPIVTVIMFGIVHAGLGFNCGGFYKCGALVSRQYAEFVIASSQLIKCAAFFVAPALVVIFVDDDKNASQWHMIFYIIAGMAILSNFLFCYYATDEPREFTKITIIENCNKKDKIFKMNKCNQYV